MKAKNLSLISLGLGFLLTAVAQELKAQTIKLTNMSDQPVQGWIHYSPAYACDDSSMNIPAGQSRKTNILCDINRISFHTTSGPKAQGQTSRDMYIGEEDTHICLVKQPAWTFINVPVQEEWYIKKADSLSQCFNNKNSFTYAGGEQCYITDPSGKMWAKEVASASQCSPG